MNSTFIYENQQYKIIVQPHDGRYTEHTIRKKQRGNTMRYAQDVTELIGHTPLLKLSRFQKRLNIETTLLGKLEYFNPGGSAKDRVGYNMIMDAERRGLIQPGDTIVEPTSGNTGVGLAMVATARGYLLILTMPETMSEERKSLLRALGAELILTPGKLGMGGAIEEAKRLVKEHGAYMPNQFGNPANPEIHEKTTGPEIWKDTDGKVDIFVAGVGTGGTITGVGRYLKQKNPDVQIVAIEPKGSAVLSGKPAGKHGLQGIGAGFVPDVLDTEIIDTIIPVSDEDAYSAARLMGETEGVLVGISCGAALHGATELARMKENEGKTIVVFLPDGGERYLSTALYK